MWIAMHCIADTLLCGPSDEVIGHGYEELGATAAHAGDDFPQPGGFVIGKCVHFLFQLLFADGADLADGDFDVFSCVWNLSPGSPPGESEVLTNIQSLSAKNASGPRG